MLSTPSHCATSLTCELVSTAPAIGSSCSGRVLGGRVRRRVDWLASLEVTITSCAGAVVRRCCRSDDTSASALAPNGNARPAATASTREERLGTILVMVMAVRVGGDPDFPDSSGARQSGQSLG